MDFNPRSLLDILVIMELTGKRRVFLSGRWMNLGLSGFREGWVQATSQILDWTLLLSWKEKSAQPFQHHRHPGLKLNLLLPLVASVVTQTSLRVRGMRGLRGYAAAHQPAS